MYIKDYSLGGNEEGLRVKRSFELTDFELSVFLLHHTPLTSSFLILSSSHLSNPIITSTLSNIRLYLIYIHGEWLCRSKVNTFYSDSLVQKNLTGENGCLDAKSLLTLMKYGLKRILPVREDVQMQSNGPKEICR